MDYLHEYYIYNSSYINFQKNMENNLSYSEERAHVTDNTKIYTR